MRHTVLSAVKLDVVIAAEFGYLEFWLFESDSWQRSHRWQVHFAKNTEPIARALLVGRDIQFRQDLLNRLIQVYKTKEVTMAQTTEDPCFQPADALLDIRLVLDILN